MEQRTETILEWYRKKHNYIDAPCGGRGDCGRCKIKFLSMPPEAGEKEKEHLSVEELEQGIRLACVTERTGQEEIEPVGDIFSESLQSVQEFEKISNVIEANKEETFGIALDIGTTTLAMRLVGLVSGLSYVTITGMNHQRAYGADVVSRIQAANQGKLEELRDTICRDISRMLIKITTQAGIHLSQIKKIVIEGNTTMCHLLLGYSCEGLGKAPFKPVNLSLMKIIASELLKDIKGDEKNGEVFSAEVVILPGISAFIGADIVAGMYACDMDIAEESCMLLDIGTNGEMVVGNREGFYATSTAAGPVFEGGNISCGMPAIKGAVAHLGKEEPKIVGGGQAQGLCGSALIDLTAFMLDSQIIDENGTLCDRYFESGYPLTEISDELSGMRLTQADIREIQMGKAAIRAGLEELLKKGKPEKLYLAGGFGAAIKVEEARRIGLLPEDLPVRLDMVGNAALEGAHKFLLDVHGEERVKRLSERIEEIILAEEGKFAENYVLFMQFLV